MKARGSRARHTDLRVPRDDSPCRTLQLQGFGATFPFLSAGCSQALSMAFDSQEGGGSDEHRFACPNYRAFDRPWGGGGVDNPHSPKARSSDIF